MSDSEDPKEDIDDAALADEWAAALEQQDTEEDMPGAVPAPLDDLMAQADAAPSSMPNVGADNPNLDVILDIPVTLTMEVGSTKINIRNLLQLNQGSVIELDRLAGEPLDVLVNGTLIAHGEVVVVNEKFGIRLTDVISPTERIKKLG